MDKRDDGEVQLARALLEGRMEAFDAFVQQFRTRIFQYSFLMCGHREDAEEVAQDTLMKVFENFASLREPERVRPWVFRIAKNACLMKRRRSIFAPEHELSLEDQVPGEIPSGGETPDLEYLRMERREALTRAIQKLSPNYRSVILLRDMEELSAEEAAEILDISVDAVKQRLHRARLSLRRLLEEELNQPRAEAMAPAGRSDG